MVQLESVRLGRSRMVVALEADKGHRQLRLFPLSALENFEPDSVRLNEMKNVSDFAMGLIRVPLAPTASPGPTHSATLGARTSSSPACSPPFMQAPVFDMSASASTQATQAAADTSLAALESAMEVCVLCCACKNTVNFFELMSTKTTTQSKYRSLNGEILLPSAIQRLRLEQDRLFVEALQFYAIYKLHISLTPNTSVLTVTYTPHSTNMLLFCIYISIFFFFFVVYLGNL